MSFLFFSTAGIVSLAVTFITDKQVTILYENCSLCAAYSVISQLKRTWQEILLLILPFLHPALL